MAVLRVFCFGSLGVTVEDVFLIDPDPEHAARERGVRVELRLLDPQPWRGSINASQKVVVDQAVWRADFLETEEGGPGSKDRMHYHPGMRNNEPGRRTFRDELTDNPMGWLAGQLADPLSLLEDAGIQDLDAYRPSADALREGLGEVVLSVTNVLAGVRAGDLAKVPVRPGPPT
ncbi:hypothetical protein [Actinomadura sp. SCN-SB]|uniref:hypothetical protein n=1 Tax=Actinomadura sp. SCN-SB TaxID=3373092 RepID=UPI0037526C9E